LSFFFAKFFTAKIFSLEGFLFSIFFSKKIMLSIFFL